ncbi:MAG: YlmC/YmxH family sporulation protein [Bacillota bacterium]|jgi:YlmC/YmxH family sporulation protein|nr:YlmC/YmxH family sporulation protein [Bacillota bacterium]
MELSQLARKEIINLYDGTRLGFVGDADLLIDGSTGHIRSIIISKGMGFKTKNARELVIPWKTVKKIGNEVIVVDIPSHP